MRQFIRFFSLMLVVSLLFWSCEQETSMDLQLPERVTNLVDFDQFVQAKIHPFDQLSTETIDEFKAKLIFTSDNHIAGGYMAGVQKELSEADLDLFMRLILGVDSEAADAGEYEASEVESRACNRYVYLRDHRNHPLVGCQYDLGDFCAICVGHDQ